MSRSACAGADITAAADQPATSREDPVTSHYAYKPLDSSANEVRILRFIDRPEDEQGLIHCTLCHVSLDRLLPAYEEFKLELNFGSQNELTKEWCESYFADKRWPRHATPTISISRSRYRAESEELYVSSRSSADESGNVPVPIPHRFEWGDFETLSYCWGSDVCDKLILVDGLQLQVTTNFENMLRHVQTLPEARSGMGFWADGVCINQLNMPEKESQIGLMKRIYAEALSTVIWLGPGHEASDRAVKVMNDAFGDCRPYDETRWYPSLKPKENISGGEWQSMLDVWDRDYFKRMWIIQELALNKSFTLFMCGSRIFSRLVLQDSCFWVRNHVGDVARVIRGSPGGAVSHANTDDIYNIASNVFNLVMLSTSDIDIDSMFDLAHRSQVKEPHDKVYGLLGLLPIPLATRITPNYSKPSKAVFTEFATLMLQDCERLDQVLSWSTIDGHDASPHWVPNWMKPHQRNHLQWFRKFTAGGTKQPGKLLQDDGETLCCNGILVDQVGHAGIPCSQLLPYQETIRRDIPHHQMGYPEQTLKNSVRRTLLHRHPSERDGASVLDLQWVDWNNVESPSTSSHMLDRIHASSHHWQFFDKFRHTNADFSVSGWSLRAFFPAQGGADTTELLESPFRKPKDLSVLEALTLERVGVDDKASDSDCSDDDDNYRLPALELIPPRHVTYASEYKDHLYNMQLTAVALRNRRLFTSSKDGLFGLAPDEIEVGDWIAILVGCNYPVILRPYRHGYKYVGECYIDGLMDGEAFQATNSDRYKFGDILIL
jgi:hypothetical protein